MLKERWLLFAAGLAAHTGVLAWVANIPSPEGWDYGAGPIVGIMLRPWVLPAVPGYAVGGPAVGIVTSILIVAAFQALALFWNQLWLKWIAGAFFGALAMWSLLVTLMSSWLVFLMPTVFGVWFVLFLNRETRRLRHRGDEAEPVAVNG